MNSNLIAFNVVFEKFYKDESICKCFVFFRYCKIEKNVGKIRFFFWLIKVARQTNIHGFSSNVPLFIMNNSTFTLYINRCIAFTEISC